MSSRNRYDVIVVGVGAMGSAACYQLASRGARVLGLEQFDIPHALGSSHGYSRMIRMAYYEHPDYVPLLRRAYELWRELERASRMDLLFEVGGVYMGPPEGHVVAGAIEAARRHGLRHEVLTHADLGKRFPQFRLPGHFTGVFEPRAGLLLPEKVVAAQAELALRGGADLRGREAVVEWNADAAGVGVRTDKAEYRADRLVFCGGPWTAKLVRDLGVELVVTRQTLAWVWPRRPALFEFFRFPVWGIEAADGSLSYGFPMSKDNPGLKVARHGRGTVTDADHVSRQITTEDEAEVRAILDLHLPDGAGPLLSMRVCLYTNSPDGHFIIDAHPKHPNVILACGFSGHGFKFASVVGEVLADLALEGRTKLPVKFLGLERFRGDGSH
jgi:sarcosine oxidase